MKNNIMTSRPQPVLAQTAIGSAANTAACEPKHYELQIARWEGRIKCAYLNNYRIAGGKPWGGYEPAATWQITLKDIADAVPEVRDALAKAEVGDDLLTEAREICAILDLYRADTGEEPCFDHEAIGEEVARRHDSLTAAIAKATTPTSGEAQ